MFNCIFSLLKFRKCIDGPCNGAMICTFQTGSVNGMSLAVSGKRLSGHLDGAFSKLVNQEEMR